MRVWLVLVIAACDGGGTVTPDANPDDLDGDGILNAADNCPTIANANQADTTEAAMNGQFPDGVGNACDLRPGLAGDEIARLSTFATEMQASSWNGSGWTIAADAASSTDNAQWQSRSGEQGDGAILVAEISALTFATGGELTIAVDGDGIQSGAACTVRETGELLARDLGGGATATANVSSLVPPITLVAWRSIIGLSASVTCRVTRGGVNTSAEAVLADTTVVGNQALVAAGASSSVTSMVLYTSPGPKSP